ncbi:MAG: hypothetical protein AAGA65_25810 [Actinomycetota bacterium]
MTHPRSRLPLKRPNPLLRRPAVALLLVVTSLVIGVGAFAPASAAQSGERSGTGPAGAIPELALLVTGPATAIDEEQRLDLIESLSEVPGVLAVTGAPVLQADGAEDLSVFYLALEGTEEAVLERSDDGLTGSDGVRSGSAKASIDEVVAQASAVVVDELPTARILVGGPAAVDRAISSSYDGPLRTLLVVATLIGLALGVVFGWQRGLVAGATLLLSVLAAGVLGGRAAGAFDGSLATTVIPGALAGLTLGTALLVRLLLWFRDPPGADEAEMIRRAVRALLPEVALVLCSLALAAVAVGLMDPGPTPLTALTTGAAVTAVVQLGITAPALTLLASAREANADLLPVSVPDGRDLPLLALSAIAGLLVVVSAFGFGQPSQNLLGPSDLSDTSDAATVAEVLRTGGADATSSVLATASGAARRIDLAEWAEAVAELPGVAWVQAGGVKYTSIEAVEISPSEALLDPSVDGVAAVVLTDPPGSEPGRRTLAEIATQPLVGGPPSLTGPAIETAGAVGERSTLLMAVVAIAVTGALAVRVLTQSVGQSIVSFLLRLIGGTTVLGLFGLFRAETQTATIVTALGAIGLAVGVFELEFVTRYNQRLEHPELGRPNPGQAGGLGLAALGLGSMAIALLSPFQDAPGMGILGLVLTVAVLVELTVGALLLRPALLGQRAAFHTAVRPVRVALHSGIEREESYQGVEDPGWRRVIGDLVQAEFRFQSEPSEAVLSAVFVPDTPLYRQAAAHHASLAGAGLRIVGLSPHLRTIKTVSGRTPVTLAVTVDHPVRHLVDSRGTVVGIRKAERRSGVLWLSESDDGSYRIAESVELGAVVIAEADAEAGTIPDAAAGVGTGVNGAPNAAGTAGRRPLPDQGAEPAAEGDVVTDQTDHTDGIDDTDQTDHTDGIDHIDNRQDHRNGAGDSGHSEQERTGL